MNWLTEVFLCILMAMTIVCMPLYILATLKPQEHIVIMKVVKEMPHVQKRKAPSGRKYKI